MVPFKNWFCLTALVLALGACSSYDTAQTIDLTVEPNDVGGTNTVITKKGPRKILDVDAQELADPTLKTTAQSQSSINIIVSGTPSGVIPIQDRLSPVPRFPSPQNRDLMVIVDKMAGSSVEIYDLDKAPPESSIIAPPRGIPSSADPRVTVYPLDPNGFSFPAELATEGQQWPNDLFPGGKRPQSSQEEGSPQSFYKPSWKRYQQQQGQQPEPTGQVYFQEGSSAIDEKGQGLIKEIAGRTPPTLTVEGHASKTANTADPVEAKIVNLRQSMNRAVKVSENLIRDGLPAERIKTVAWGDTYSSDNNDESRRVDIRLGHR